MSRPGKKRMLPYEWHVLYGTALLETNLHDLRGKVDAAESALHQREFELKTVKKSDPEHGAIKDALRALRTLRLRVTV
jgi:hypothetical protein